MFNFGKCYKYLNKVNHGFWDITKILSYGRALMLVTGTRSLGKSTQVALLSLFTYVIFGKQCMYLRRFTKALQKTYKKFFSNAIRIYNDHAIEFGFRKIIGFKTNGGTYYICFGMDEEDKPIWEEFGYYGALSEEEDIKSLANPNIVILIYDEFISKDENKYLGTKDNIEFEWTALHSLCVTIDRDVDKPCREELAVFCLGNKSNVYNPIMLTIGVCDYIDPFHKQRFTAPKDLDWVWEDIDKVEATENMTKSTWYRLAPENVKKYDYLNESTMSNDFIKRPDKSYAKYYFTIRFKGNEYGVYSDIDRNYYIDAPRNNENIISLDVVSHDSTDSELIRTWKENGTMCKLTERYTKGKLYFGSGKIQAIFLKYLEFTR